MAYQPKDVMICAYNDQVFKQLSTILSLDGLQCSNSSFGNDSDTHLSSSSQSSNVQFHDEDVTSSSLNGYPTTSVMRDDPVDVEELFRGQSLGVIHYFNEPVIEVTVTTTPSGVDENMTKIVTDVSSELNLDDLETLSFDQIENLIGEIKQLSEKASLESIDELIVERIMGVKTHLPANLRLRYKTDGPRQVAKSLTNPMAIDIPNLKNIQLNSDQTFLIRLLLATWTENPSDHEYLHQNKLEYHSDEAIVFSDGTIGVPLTSDDITEGIKAFPRLQILKTKLRTYDRELTPLNLSGIASGIDGNETITVNEAKKIFNKYNLKAGRIICQLLIKENESFHFTDIICATHKMEETQQPRKRPKESTQDDEEEEEIDERPSRSKSTKRKKNSH
ncbi:unnamed protein product [Adineta steineri]|uniref:Uncharacterized protein n=1 Tax=Adineta steineri TaxID=433720 RepID=A0A814BXV3_9BILA|nr:unnamed protein product [Adineta steineri]CAF3968745.1 unnamed protein product [Adineta steineri]